MDALHIPPSATPAHYPHHHCSEGPPSTSYTLFSFNSHNNHHLLFVHHVPELSIVCHFPRTSWFILPQPCSTLPLLFCSVRLLIGCCLYTLPCPAPLVPSLSSLHLVQLRPHSSLAYHPRSRPSPHTPFPLPVSVSIVVVLSTSIPLLDSVPYSYVVGFHFRTPRGGSAHAYVPTVFLCPINPSVYIPVSHVSPSYSPSRHRVHRIYRCFSSALSLS